MKDIYGKEFHPTEMYKLINLMIETDHHFKVVENMNTPQIIFYDYNLNIIGDAICHGGSFGHEKGLLEIMGLDLEDDDILGCLTAEEVLNHYINALQLQLGKA